MQQIIYQESLQTFILDCLVTQNIGEKVTIGMFNAGYSHNQIQENWINSWKKSLPEIAKALKDSSIDKDVDVAVEYRLKHSMERLDFLIYGVDNNNNKNMVIVELKQWSHVDSTDSMNKVFAMVSKISLITNSIHHIKHKTMLAN